MQRGGGGYSSLVVELPRSPARRLTPLLPGTRFPQQPAPCLAPLLPSAPTFPPEDAFLDHLSKVFATYPCSQAVPYSQLFFRARASTWRCYAHANARVRTHSHVRVRTYSCACACAPAPHVYILLFGLLSSSPRRYKLK